MWPFKRKQKGEVFAQGHVGFSGAAVAVHNPAKPVAKHQTPADVLDYWCHKFGATYDRERTKDNVRIRVHLPSGDTLSGNGTTTVAAVTAVVTKLEAVK